ncbi:MAG: Gfo/Idh/MocA family protein [Armatimonadota bacterium]
MPQQRYRVAILGHTGAGDYGHGLDVVYNGMPEVRVAAVSDPDPAGRAACAARTGAAAQYADYRELLEREKPDLVSVSPRWIAGHREMVLACAAAGVKGIYCEKPFARTLAEADEMVEACRRSGTRVAVAHQNRALPYLEHVRKLVQSGAIGTLRRIRGKGKDDSRGGAQDLIVLGTHVLDQMRYLAGDPLWAWAHLRQDDRDIARGDVREGSEQVGPIAGNNLTGYYAFPHGVAGSYESYAGRGASRHMGLWIEGTQGTITLHGGFAKQAWLCKAPQWTPELGTGAWEPIRLPEWDRGMDGHPRSETELQNLANQKMVRALIECLEKGGSHFSSDNDARWAMEMYLALPESQRTGERVALPMKERGSAWAKLA